MKMGILTKTNNMYRLLRCQRHEDGAWKDAEDVKDLEIWAEWNPTQIGTRWTAAEIVSIRANGDYTVLMYLLRFSNGLYALYVEENWENKNDPEKTFVGPLLADKDEAWEKGYQASKKAGICYL